MLSALSSTSGIRLSGWPLYSRGTAMLVVACITVYGVWSVKASGLAGTFERAAIIIPLVWTFTFVRRLGTGVPFMASSGQDERR